MKKKRIPYAIANFERLQNENYYFVDKTEYIEKLENHVAPVFLRPRRFGKTLWCSILECYYDIKLKSRFDQLFGETYIGKNPTPEQGKYLVLRFNFSVVEVSESEKEIKESFDRVCQGVFNIFLSRYADYFSGFNSEYITAVSHLGKIVDYVNAKNLPPLYIIIDEYDNFTNQLITSHQDGLYKDITTGNSFLRTFFKVIKAGTETESIRRTFITGVLPVTIDDLTSGFNIAKIVTLSKSYLSMLGFTQTEVDRYLDMLQTEYGFSRFQIDSIRVLLKNYYNGYCFAVNAEPLYNSTILSYFLDEFVNNDGEIPTEFIDHNLKTDINWIRRLTVRESNTKEMLEALIIDGNLSYDSSTIRSKFNLRTFFAKEFYPVSLFYLGMLTFANRSKMVLPNQTMRTIFVEYFNEVEKFNVSLGYAGLFDQFYRDLDLEKLFAGYWEKYIGQIPAQAFDKVNENFYRTTFYELCRRHLSDDFIFNIEVNYPCGRSDWELLGKPHSEYKNLKYVVEFKHFSKAQGKTKKIMELKQPFAADSAQITRYADEIRKDFPDYTITRYVIYTIGRSGYNFFKLEL